MKIVVDLGLTVIIVIKINLTVIKINMIAKKITTVMMRMILMIEIMNIRELLEDTSRRKKVHPKILISETRLISMKKKRGIIIYYFCVFFFLYIL